MYDFSNYKLTNWWNLKQEEHEIDMGISGMMKAIELNEESIEKVKLALKQIEQSVQEEFKEETPDILEQIVSQYARIDDEVSWELERSLRNSMLLTIYSFFEGKLKEICELIEQDFNFQVKIEDLRSSDDIGLYVKYIEKVFGLKIAISIEKHLTPLKHNKQVRNIIAHQNSNFTQSQSKKLPNIKGIKKYLRVDGSGFLLIESVIYIESIINNVKLFFKELIEQLDEHYGELKIRDN
jgi:hypothetical protein